MDLRALHQNEKRSPDRRASRETPEPSPTDVTRSRTGPLRNVCPYEVACAYISLGEKDQAYRWFRKGIDERADCMAWLGVEPWVEPFRKDPRYNELLREIGLTAQRNTSR